MVVNLTCGQGFQESGNLPLKRQRGEEGLLFVLDEVGSEDIAESSSLTERLLMKLVYRTYLRGRTQLAYDFREPFQTC